jgi:threonine dehydrogenase-like Zn-dependent dehydrogenase
VFEIPETMRAVVYRGANDLRVETVPVPRIGPNELLVKVAACGVCPTDIKKIQYATVPPPRIFGHETAGTIVKVGNKVRGLKAGDRVALHHHVPCLKCHACRHHAFAQCAQYKRTGITAGFEPAGGGYAEYVRVMPFVLPGVIRIPPRNSFLEGAMLEPVNTVLKAVNRLALLRGDTVMVAGQGPIGLMFTRLLALRGMKVLATDLLETRLEMAREFGAAATFRVQNSNAEGTKILTAKYAEYAEEEGLPQEGTKKQQENPELPQKNIKGAKILTTNCTDHTDKATDRSLLTSAATIAETVDRLTQGRGLDAAVIAVPSDAVVREAQELVRGGGQVLLFSHTRRGEESGMDLARICVDEKDLIGSYSADFLLQAEVARLVFSRKLDVRRLITHQFLLEETAAAIELASKPTAESLKIVVSQAGEERTGRT